MQCELAGLHPGCGLLCGHLPHLWLRAPRALESWHTWQPRPARPRRPDLELAGACQLPDQNQYTRRLLPKFQVQRSPMRASFRQMGNFWVVGSWAPLVERPGRPSFRLAAVSAISMLPRGRGSQLEATGHQLDPKDHLSTWQVEAVFLVSLCSQVARTVSFYTM